MDVRIVICGLGRVGRAFTTCHEEHPLANVRGTEKAISYLTDTMDRVTVSGGKSNPVGAAAAILKDIIRIYGG